MKPYFPIDLLIDGRRCVIIGAPGDREADQTEAALAGAGALVARIDPDEFREEDLEGATLVISQPQDAHLSHRLQGLAEKYRFILCCVDQPEQSTAAMPAVAKAGLVRVAISTGGQAPGVAKRLKQSLQHAMDPRFEQYVHRAAEKRERDRREASGKGSEGFDAEIVFYYPDWFGE